MSFVLSIIPLGYCSVAITGMFKILAACTYNIQNKNKIKNCIDHFLRHNSNFRKISNDGLKLFLHVTEEEVSVL